MSALAMIDSVELAVVTGGIVEGGCVLTPPTFPPGPDYPQPPKIPVPKGNPFDLSNIGTTRPK